MAESVDYLNPLFICEEESRSGPPGEVVDLGTFSYFWDGTGQVWLSSRPDGHDGITFHTSYSFIDVDGPLGRKSFFAESIYIPPRGTRCCLTGNYGNEYNDQVFYGCILEPGWNEISVQARNRTNSYGSFGTSAIYVITIPYPEPSFTASPLSGLAPLTVQLTDTSLYIDSAVCGRYSSYRYRIYDYNGYSNSIYGSKNPTVTFEGPGVYGIVLVVANDNGGHQIFTRDPCIHVLRDRTRQRRAAWMNLERPIF